MTHLCAELVARCFAARTSAHFAHLCTKSFAQHSALGDFYDAIASAADEYVECYMGIYGQLTVADFPNVRPATGEITQQLTDLREWIVANRDECSERCGEESDEPGERGEAAATELANLIDNILAVIDRALYKLKFLK